MGYKELPSDPAVDALCACPACGAEYSIAEIPCKHLVGDWCFTADYEIGSAKGQWATEEGNDLLVAVDTAVHELRDLADNHEWRSEEERLHIFANLPMHLRDAIDGWNGWSGLLKERIVASPGYLGTHEVVTNSMASDAWSVHWAEDGSKAARFVEKLFHEDLKLLRAVLVKAKEAVLPE